MIFVVGYSDYYYKNNFILVYYKVKMSYYRRKNWRRYYGFKGYGKRSAGRSFKGRMRFTRDSAKMIANKALLTANYVRKLINVEYKFLDGSVAASISTTPSVNYLTNIGQGDGESNRDGDSVKIKSLQLAYTLSGNTSADATFVRCIIGIDKLHSGTDVTASGGTDNSLLTNTDMTSQRDRDNSKRFIVLYDKVHSFSNNGPETYYKKIFKKFNMKTQWDGTNGTDRRVNHLFFIAYSDQATNTPTLAMRYRTTYIDN